LSRRNWKWLCKSDIKHAKNRLEESDKEKRQKAEQKRAKGPNVRLGRTEDEETELPLPSEPALLQQQRRLSPRRLLSGSPYNRSQPPTTPPPHPINKRGSPVSGTLEHLLLPPTRSSLHNVRIGSDRRRALQRLQNRIEIASSTQRTAEGRMELLQSRRTEANIYLPNSVPANIDVDYQRAASDADAVGEQAVRLGTEFNDLFYQEDAMDEEE
jgi:hypothetical protein